jgi:lipoate-protein ligase A
MKKWRFITVNTDIVGWVAAWVPAICKSVAEGKSPDTLAAFFMEREAAGMALYPDALVDLNYDACKKYNVRIGRGPLAAGGITFNGPGTGDPWFSLIWNIEHNPEIPKDPEIILCRLLSRGADIQSTRYKLPVRFRPTNDVEIWDPNLKMWRKMCGAGASDVVGGKAFHFHWAPWAFKQEEHAYEIMASPADKYADKVAKEAALRNWNWEEAGAWGGERPPLEQMRREWIDTTTQMVEAVFGMEFEPGEVTEEEKKLGDELYKYWSSEEVVLSKSPDYKFRTIPEGTRLGKSVAKVPSGPTVRVAVLRRGDIIEDMLFSGICHMSPSEGFEIIEKELKGCKIDENIIKAKINEVWARHNVMLAFGSADTVANVVMEACKESYKQA